MPLLTVSDLDAGYGDILVLDGVDLRVEEGEYVAITGPNGAGKSTLLKSIFGLTTLMGGRITFKEESITDLRTEEIIDRKLGMVPQEHNIFTDLTVLENLQMGAHTLDDLSESDLNRVYERFPVLEERIDQKAGQLSGGQRQMLAISRVLVTDPDLLVLDEPSSGLAPHLVQDLFDEIDAINEDGTAVLIVEQQAEEIFRRADRGYILAQGEIRREGPTDELVADEKIRAEFFGT